MKSYNAIACCCVTILLFCMLGVSAAPYNIYYTLAHTGQVSLNIYDASGHVVRELLHAAPKSAGTHMISWDGKEPSGIAVPNTRTCTWKLLATPNGLTADFKINLGNTYPSLYAGATNFFDAYPLGSHETCSAVTVDADSIYMCANTAESNPACIKLSKSNPTKRDWSCGNFDTFTGAISMACDNANTLYVLGNGLALKDPDTGQNPRGPYQLFKVHADNPYIPNGPFHPNYAAIPTKWTIDGTDYYAQDVDVCNTTIVLMYPEAKRICWVDSNGTRLKWVDFSQMTPGDLTPQGVTVGSDGTVYVAAISKSTPAATGIYTTAGGTPTALVTGLINPGRLDIDHSNGDIYVIIGDTLGNREYVKRYSSTGQLKNSYGAGMPTDGLYDPKHFDDLADIAAMGDGQSFIVAEPHFVRRVIKVQSSDGTILKEWYGGLPWCPWVTVDPDNPNVVWVVGNTNNHSNGGNNYCMRLLVDYAKGTYQIHSVYRMDTLCNGIAPSTGFATSWKMLKRRSTGVKYLCAEGDHCALPYLIKIDEAHWKLKPVTLCATVFQDPQDTHPQWLKNLAGPTNHSFQWTDLNGDGKPLNDDGTVQTNEFTFNPSGFTYWAGTSIGSDFTYYGLPVGGRTLNKLPVASWNGDVPTYDTAAMTFGIPYATMPAAWVNDSLYASFAAHDNSTATTYVALQNMSGWDVNTGYAQLVKVKDAAGLSAKPVWQVGSYDDYTGGNGGGVQPPLAGSIHGVRHFAGRTHNCSVLQDFIGGWATVGYLSDNADYPITYVYDDDGLWVGNLFDHVNPTQQRKDFNLCSENACGDMYTNPNTGAMTYFGSGENQIYVYNITGWNNWERHNGRVVMTPVNIPPVANAGGLSVIKDVAQTGTLVATDENNDPLTYRIVTNGTKGTAVLTNPATGQFAYTPNHGATGTDTVTFRANDGTCNSNISTIAVTITDCGSPQIEWKFDGNLNDASGHGYTGTFKGGTATYQAVGAGQALVGDGLAGQVSNASFPTPTAFTVSFWLNPTSFINFNQGITAINGWGAFVFCATEGGGVYVGTDVPTRMTPYDLGGGTLTTGVWQQFTFTFANGTGKFYKNGVLLCTKTAMTAPTTWGGFTVGATATSTIHGLIDDVRVYNTCLSDTAVALVYASYAPTDGLKCYWKMDETSGATADDSSGTGNAGATYNGPTWTAGKLANGLSFNGSNQYVQLTSASGLPAANAAQTICCWLYVSATPSERKTALAVTGNTSGVYLGYLDSTTFGVWKYNNTPLVTTTMSPMAGAWHHIAYVKNGSMNYLYIDGAQVATSTVSADTSSATTITAGGGLGKNYWPGKLTDGRVTSTDYWQGKLDEVRIYSRALSATEISALGATKQ